MKITTLYKYGFYYKDVPYGWKHKKLFRLPYQKNKRTYALLEVPFYCFKSTTVANIQKQKLTIKRLESLTTEVNIEVVGFINSDCPF